MKIATPLFAVLLAFFSVVFVRQAKRAWRDPDWEPDSTTQSPRSAIPVAVLFVSFTVFFAGGSVFYDVAGGTGQDAGAGAVMVGFLGLVFALITNATTSRWQRPRFMVPPSQRAAYGRLAVQTLAAALARPDPAEAADPEAGDEFVIIAGYGSHLASATRDTGRLVLTSRRLILLTRRPEIPGVARNWPVAQLREVRAGRGDSGLTIRSADGHEEAFTVDKRREEWLQRMSRLLSMPKPMTSWYGDPPGSDQPVTTPAGKAVIVLFRAEGERRDRLLGYRVLLDGRRAGKIRRGRRINIPVAPGRHILHLRSVWLGSPFVPFEAQAGQAIRFCCEPGGFPGMRQADMERDVTGYIRLRRR